MNKLMPWTKNNILEYLDFPVQKKQLKVWKTCDCCNEKEAVPENHNRMLTNYGDDEEKCEFCESNLCKECREPYAIWNLRILFVCKICCE